MEEKDGRPWLSGSIYKDYWANMNSPCLLYSLFLPATPGAETWKSQEGVFQMFQVVKK